MTEAKKTIKRQLQGVVVGGKMDKTKVVSIERLKKHPKYAKYVRIVKKFKTHDENNEYQAGDRVVIEECRPLSREKRWRIIRKI